MGLFGLSDQLSRGCPYALARDHFLSEVTLADCPKALSVSVHDRCRAR
jgi:hypothetical protein